MRRRHIIAIGGGGFSTTEPDAKLAAYILKQTGKRAPKICCLPTAMGDSDSVIANFSKLAKKLGAKPSYLSLFNQPLIPLGKFVLRNDAIYVGGGNTRNMLVLWKAWGVDAILREAYERGIVMAGHSAGALCWFVSGVTDSFPGRLAPLRCLGWLPGSFCPHYDGEAQRRPVYHRLVKAGLLPRGYAADDRVALHFIDGHLERVVSDRRRANAYRVFRRAGLLKEETIVPEILR